MKFVLKSFIFISVVFFSIQPSFSAGVNKTMTTIIESWIGENINTVINQWGFPSEEKVIAGRKIYVWRDNKTIDMPSDTSGTINHYGNTSYYQGTTFGGQSINAYCNRILEVDKSEKVISGTWEGNNCPFALVLKYKTQWLNQKNSKSVKASVKQK